MKREYRARLHLTRASGPECITGHTSAGLLLLGAYGEKVIDR